MSKKTTNGNLQGALGEFVPAASQYIYKMTLQKGIQDCLTDLGSNMSYHINSTIQGICIQNDIMYCINNQCYLYIWNFICK